MTNFEAGRLPLQIGPRADIRVNRTEARFAPEALTKEIVGSTVDDLVVMGIQHVMQTGEPIDVTAGRGSQSFGVNYTLMNSRNRVHTLRPVAPGYLASELLAFFKGSLHINDGLEATSSFWAQKADKDGFIQSNYGYYVFHEPIKDKDGNVLKNSDGTPMSQYDWTVATLDRNLQSRKGLINLNQPMNKVHGTLDFPCVIGAQYFVRNDSDGKQELCCEISSRSTDIVTGLPYNVAFFSFLTELIYADLVQRGHTDLQLGYTRLKASFTQIYDRTRKRAIDMVHTYNTVGIDQSKTVMPPITDAQATLKDIYEGTATTPVMQWLHEQTYAYGRDIKNGVVTRRSTN